MAEQVETPIPPPPAGFQIENPPPPPPGFELERPAVERPGLAARSGAQFLAGLNDVTALLAAPFEQFDTPVYTPGEGLQFLTPEEVRQRRAQGTVGVPGMATEDPTDLPGAAMRMAGQTLAAGPILGTAARAVSAAPRAATFVGRMAQAPRNIVAGAGTAFARAPVATTAVETGLGASAGAGGFAANMVFPDSDAAKVIGELLGGTLPALTPTGMLMRGAQWLRSFVRSPANPLTAAGGRNRAIARLQRAVPEEAREQALREAARETTIDPDTGQAVLSFAQRTGDPGLLALEASVLESSEELLRRGDAAIANANTVIQRSLRSLGDAPPAAAARPIAEAQQYLDNLLDTRMRIAAQRVDERVSELGAGVSREQANRVAREEIDSAYSAARAQERQLYSLIDPETPAPFSEAQSALQRFQSEIGKAQRRDIPVDARLLDPKAPDTIITDTGETTIKELRSLQSKLRETARNARAGDKKNLNKARIADDIANAITDDVANARGGPEVGDAVRTAVAFSRSLHDRFSRGTVGKILGRDVAGGDRIPAGLTLEQSLGVAGPRAREAMDDLIKAFDSPEAPSSALLVESAETFLRARFLQKAVERGQFNARAASRFMVQNEELLKRLPRVRAQLAEAIESGDELAVAARQRARVRLDDPRVSKATMLIEKGPVEAFRQIGKLTPAEAARETQMLVNRAMRDPSGEALQGMKSGFVEFLMTGAKQAARDSAGTPIISGFALRDALQVESTRAAANRLFSPAELNRLGVITRDLIRIERARSAQAATEGVLGDRPSRMIETLAGLLGAASGRAQAARLGVGGTVQIPGIMANRFRDLANAGVRDPGSRLLRDAVIDDTGLMEELLLSSLDESGQLSAQAARRMNAWAAVVLAENGGAFSQDAEQPSTPSVSPPDAPSALRQLMQDASP